MNIRRAKLSEADFLSDLSMLSKQSNGYGEDFMEMCRDELRVTQERLEKGEYWVAETESEEICGCVCLCVESDDQSGEVHAFFIHPDWQRRGLGKKLWNKILERAIDQNLKLLHLDADPFAVAFYELLGFKTVRETPSGSIADRTIPYMELHL